MIERTPAATVHGRYLVMPPTLAGPAPVLVGFHGYAEDAEAQMERLRAIPESARWLKVSIGALHPFYRGRTNQVVDSWMTSRHRELAIADNIAYVNACVDAVAAEWNALPVVAFAGFSQGVAMAYRAAVHSTRAVAGVISVGGDLPPEIGAEQLRRIPRVLVARGRNDPLYSAEMFAADGVRLRASTGFEAFEFEGGHEWSGEVSVAASRFLGAFSRGREVGA